MAQHVKRFGKWLLVLIPLALLAVLLARQKPASATMSDPHWTTSSTNMECACAASCSSCGGPPPATVDGVMPDGSFTHSQFVLDNPTKGGGLRLVLTYRGAINGYGQFGSGWNLNYEYSVKRFVTNSSDPWGAFSNYVLLNTPSGYVGRYDWAGSSTGYVQVSCAEVRSLTMPSGTSGNYLLVEPSGAEIEFDDHGLASVFRDPNGNTTTLTFNSNQQLTSIEDDRGFDYTISRSSDGFVSQIANPTHRDYTFGYDTYGNLTLITTPASAHQTGGVTYEFAYDTLNRMTTIKDGRGNTVKTIAYVGTSYQVDSMTVDGETIDYTYQTDRIDRTDRLGNVHRRHFSGSKIIQEDMWIGGAAEYVTTYTYGSDDRLAYKVLPRGNRIEYTWDANGNLLSERHKTTNTSSNDSSDIVHAWTYTNNRVGTYADPLGNITEYTRDGAGNVTQIDYPDVTSPTSQTASKSFTYNSYGQLTQSTDEEGKVTSCSYYTSGDDIHLLQSVTVDPAGLALTTTYEYDGYWNVDSIVDPRGGMMTITSDALRRQIEVLGPNSLSKVRYEYDADGHVTKKEVQNRNKDNNVITGNEWWTTTFAFNTLGDLTSMTEEISSTLTRTTSFEYDAEQQQIRVTKPEGNKVKTDYNERGLVWKVTRGETSSVATSVENFYDDNGNLIEVKDGRGNSTTYTYDLFDRRTRETNALGHYTERTLDKNGQGTEVANKDSSNNILLRTSSYYDERGRLWKKSDLRKDPATTYSDAVTEITRKKTGHVYAVTDARNKVTIYAYDSAWRPTKVTDALGNEVSWSLDANGNANSWTIHDEDAGGDVEHTYEATYDLLNRQLTTVEVDRTNSSNALTTTNGYDSRGNLVWQVNAAGNPTRWTYDGLSRMMTKDVALAYGSQITNFTSYIRTQWVFDKNDRLTTHKDDAEHQTFWTYDACDRATAMTYPDSLGVSYSYDANGNVVKTIDAAGNDIDDTYDVLNQRTARNVTLATGFLDTTSESFDFDAAGRMIRAQDNDYKVEFTHAVLGLQSRVYEEKQSYATGTAYLRTVTKTWDAMGNKATEAYPSGLNLAYSWTDINQLASIADGSNTIASWTHGGRRLKQVDYQNGTNTLMGYTGFRREVGTAHHKNSSNGTILQLDYGYDANHDRLYERYGASGSAGDGFAYDKARRLTKAWMGSVTPTTPASVAYTTKLEYNMDDDGNRTSVVTTPYGSSSTTVSYTANSLNQYTAVGATSRSHDANGNVTDDGTYLYEYNYKNLICRAKLKSTSSTVGEYRYDALGRRVERVITGATYRYIYSGLETVSVYTSTGTWKQDYVYDSDLDGIVMLSQADVLDFDGDGNTAETTRSYYHRNAVGSVMEVTDMNQAVAVSYRYDPYGNITITRNSTTQSSDPLGQYVTYSGRWRDEECGGYYFRARAYDALRGRFVQRDPLGVDVDSNLLTYCHSNPINLRDPRGLDTFNIQAEWTDKEKTVSKHCTVVHTVVCYKGPGFFPGTYRPGCGCVELTLQLDWDVSGRQKWRWWGEVVRATYRGKTQQAEDSLDGAAVMAVTGAGLTILALICPPSLFLTVPALATDTTALVLVADGELSDEEDKVVDNISDDPNKGEWKKDGDPDQLKYSNWRYTIISEKKVKCPAGACDCAIDKGLIRWTFQSSGDGAAPPGMPGPPK